MPLRIEIDDDVHIGFWRVLPACDETEQERMSDAIRFERRAQLKKPRFPARSGSSPLLGLSPPARSFSIAFSKRSSPRGTLGVVASARSDPLDLGERNSLSAPLLPPDAAWRAQVTAHHACPLDSVGCLKMVATVSLARTFEP